jgi:tetratricopeptide (TPR) repeat protein
MSRPILARQWAPLLLALVFASAVATAQSAETAWQRAYTATRAGDWAAAIGAYREHLAAKPEDAWSWFALGSILHGQGEYPSAQQAFEKALEHQVSVPFVAQYNLAASLARQGRMEPALATLEEALAGGLVSGQQLLEDPDFQALAAADRSRLAHVADEAHRPCLHKPEYGEFDFWVGEWEVRIPSGYLAARDTVTRSADGCVVEQHWEGTLGNSAVSYSFYDSAEEKWRQAWIVSGGLAGTMEGGLESGSMVLVGNAPAFPGSIARATWTPQPDGTVEFQTERSADQGATWTPTPRMTYHRVGDKAP